MSSFNPHNYPERVIGILLFTKKERYITIEKLPLKIQNWEEANLELGRDGDRGAPTKYAALPHTALCLKPHAKGCWLEKRSGPALLS